MPVWTMRASLELQQVCCRDDLVATESKGSYTSLRGLLELGCLSGNVVVDPVSFS